MSNLNLKIKRLIAYIIQVIFIIIIYTVIFILFNIIFIKVIQLIFSFILSKFQDNLQNVIFGLNLQNSNIIHLIQNFNISDFNLHNLESSSMSPEIFKYILNSPFANKISILIIILLVVYSFIFFTLLPYMTKVILYITGDIGKKILGLSVVRNGRKVNNSTSILTSPAYNTFKLYYRLVLFFLISRPLYLAFLNLNFPKYFIIIIKLFYILSIIQVIASLIKIFLYFINFLVDNDKWRTEKKILVVDNFKKYTKEFKENNVRFPTFYNFMMNNNYSISSYYRLEKKSKEIKRLSELMNHIEENQEINPNYINENIDQVNSIVNLVKRQ